MAVHTARPKKPRESAPNRCRELAWLRDKGEILRSYAGEWVVLQGDRLITHGRDAVTVVNDAKKKGVAIPYLFFVEAADKDTVWMGL